MSVIVTEPNKLYLVGNIAASTDELATGDLYTAKQYTQVELPADMGLDSVCEAFNQFLSGVGYPMPLNRRVGLTLDPEQGDTTSKVVEAVFDLHTLVSDQAYDPEPQHNPMFDGLSSVELSELATFLQIIGFNLVHGTENSNQFDLPF